MFHLAGFWEDVDPTGIYNTLNGLADTQLTVNGTNIQVPTLNQIVALAGGADNTAAPIMRLTAPSLRNRSLFQISPLNTAGAAADVEPQSPPAVVDLRSNPLKMVTGEQMQCELNSNPAAAQMQWLMLWLADNPIVPAAGNIFTARATNATAIVAEVWDNQVMTFDENLPRGRYQVVGMKAISAGCVAARVLIPGQSWRPGVLGCDAVEDIDHPMCRNGGLGVFGEFEDTDQISVDFLSILADAAQIVYFDLIQVREGPG